MTDNNFNRQTLGILNKLRDVCIDQEAEPMAAVIALIRMAGFMLMVAQSQREFELQADTALDKEEFFKLIIKELNDAYDGALSTRETVDLINRVGGTSDA
jgi:hypothetical protein